MVEILLVNLDEELIKDWCDGGYLYKNLMQWCNYECQKYCLQVEFFKFQVWVKEIGQKVVIFFEGCDVVGKGGIIKCFMEYLNLCGVCVVVLEKLSEIECGQWYFQCYVEYLLINGEIVMFDCFWYNWVGVEWVMGFCFEVEYVEFVCQVLEFECMLVCNGIYLIKFWFLVSCEEQCWCFGECKVYLLKQWKLLLIDFVLFDKWDDYIKVKEVMFFYIDIVDVLWMVIKFNCKKWVWFNVMCYVLYKLLYNNKDMNWIGNFDLLIVGCVNVVFECGEYQGVLIL